jgi:hypothetical protein
MLLTIQSRTLSSRLLSENVKIKIFKTLILSLVMYDSETWPLAERYKGRRCLRTGDADENIWTEEGNVTGG